MQLFCSNIIYSSQLLIRLEYEIAYLLLQQFDFMLLV